MDESRRTPEEHKVFWDNKIIDWEHNRYDRNNEKASWLEVLASRSSSSLRYRLQFTGDFIAKRCRGKSVVEIGCGSGRLASGLISAGAKSYCGYDISSVAIEEANKLCAGAVPDGQVTFATAGIDDLSEIDADIVFSIGLLDWLDDEELRTLFEKSTSSDCLHAFSETRWSVTQLLHRTYVHMAYGHRTAHYVPRYMNATWLGEMFRSITGRDVHLLRDRRLSFGAFFTTFNDM